MFLGSSLMRMNGPVDTEAFFAINSSGRLSLAGISSATTSVELTCTSVKWVEKFCFICAASCSSSWGALWISSSFV